MPCCPACGGTDIDYDAQRGDAVCIQCGTVLEENAIVNEVTFAQDAGGSSSVVGQFIANTPGVQSSGLGFGRESRELAFSNGQRHIAQLSAALRLAEHHQEAAQRLYMLAVQHNFIQGRRTQHVIAACLYAVCRREKTPHLLIDYSDVLQTNVYVLGSCFLKFTRLLSLTLPIIDPSLYIHRFASSLEFGDKSHLVSMSALRLVQRMKRDWIQTGRRPAGICGAALLIAARVHGFRRTQKEVVRVVRICDVTLRKRLTEFASTPLGNLTAQQLETADLDNLATFPAADPPSYTKNRLLEANELRTLTMSKEEAVLEKHEAAIKALSVLEMRAKLSQLGEPVSGRKNMLAQRLLELLPPTEFAAAESEQSEAETRIGAATAITRRSDAIEEEMNEHLRSSELTAIHPEGAAGAGAGADANAGGSASDSSNFPAWLQMDMMQSREETEGSGELEQEALMEEMNADLDTLDDEVDCYLIHDESEVEIKERVWNEMNREYLEEQAARQALREEAELAAAERGDVGDGSDTVGSKGKKKRKSGARGQEAGSVAEALESELRRNRLSNRINYDIANLISTEVSEDAALLPDTPGPVGSLEEGAGSPGGDALLETMSARSDASDFEPRY